MDWLTGYTNRRLVIIRVEQKDWAEVGYPVKFGPLTEPYYYSETPALPSEVEGNPDFWGDPLDDPQISENWFVQSRAVYRNVLPPIVQHRGIAKNFVCTTLDNAQVFPVGVILDDRGDLVDDTLWLNVTLQPGDNQFYLYYTPVEDLLAVA
jgi:hypothetical protein